jgi:hypothetical protein
MDKREAVISVVILVVIVTAYFVYYIISQTPKQQTHNLVSNPGFEEGFKGWNGYWYNLSTTEKASGKYSVLVAGTIATFVPLDFPGTYRMGLSYKPLSIDKPVCYFGLSYYFVFSRDQNGIWSVLQVYHPEYGDSARIISDVNIGNGWRKLTVEFNITTNSLEALMLKEQNYVCFYVAKDPQYVDDFFLELVSVSAS